MLAAVGAVRRVRAKGFRGCRAGSETLSRPQPPPKPIVAEAVIVPMRPRMHRQRTALSRPQQLVGPSGDGELPAHAGDGEEVVLLAGNRAGCAADSTG